MHPFLAPQFQVRWSTLVPEAIEPDIRQALSVAEANIEAICCQDLTTADYESTFLGYENASASLTQAWDRIDHLTSVNDSPALREAYGAVLPDLTRFIASVSLNDRLWALIKSVGASAEIATLPTAQQRHVEVTLAKFRESGAELPAAQKLRFAEIEDELSEATKTFSEHVLDATNAWELIITDEAQLAGLPDSAKAGAAANARAKGHQNAWRFTLQGPSMEPLMKFLADESIRKQAWQASNFVARGGEYDNTALVWQILKLRQEKAKLLGYPHFADLNLLHRMAKNGAAALAFVDELHARARPTFVAEFDELAQYKATKTGQPVALLDQWEDAYWAEKQRIEKYDFDQEHLRPYFPLAGVMSGMFEISSRLFGITVRERETIFIDPSIPQASPPDPQLVETWHPECKYYEVHDAKTAKIFGTFYVDWYPRESKNGGAWMAPIHITTPATPHGALMVGNLSPPIDGKEALLTHRDVETIFHEFGHLLHVLLSEVAVKSLAGTNVTTDWVELPSQLMENFCWERETLDLFARHFETGETIPEELFAKMVAAKNYRSAGALMGQLCTAKIDLEVHTRFDDFLGKDLDLLEQEVLAAYVVPRRTPSWSRLRRHNHLFSESVGYAAGYYSYKWSEVLDADAFSRFSQEGVLNPITGADFRKNILSTGNSAPPDELYRRFMGRDPKLDPILIRAGLAATH